VRPFALWLGLPLAAGVAVYTAFLFGQAEGRDLWQSSLLPLHLLLQAATMGGAIFLLLDLALDVPTDQTRVATILFVGGLVLDLLVTLLGEFGMPHASEIAAQAAHDISHGTYKNHFWWGSIALGHAAPLGLMLLGAPLSAAVAGLCAIVGLYFYEYAFVMAPQDIPNS
jgi:formate-dependent nitrite reductase membrane component NrfD